MRQIAHTNLIQAVAAYEKDQEGGDRCFVFPWASGGNLRQMWMRDSPPLDPKDVFPWAWQQIRGLTEGLFKLHEKGTRHGDLKPENILIFTRVNEPKPGSLVIADVGIAKYHAYETSVRKARNLPPTTTRTFTRLYEPPEIRLADDLSVISRRYDSWSLGCVLLEFVIWLQCGRSGLKDFHEERGRGIINDDRFWSPEGGKDGSLHPAASGWIHKLLKRFDKQPKLRPWRKLLNLVKSHLLVVGLDRHQSEHRKSIKEFWEELQRIHEKCSADLSGPYIWERSDMVLTKSRKSAAQVIDDFDMSISQQVSSAEIFRSNFAG